MYHSKYNSDGRNLGRLFNLFKKKKKRINSLVAAISILSQKSSKAKTLNNFKWVVPFESVKCFFPKAVSRTPVWLESILRTLLIMETLSATNKTIFDHLQLSLVVFLTASSAKILHGTFKFAFRRVTGFRFSHLFGLPPFGSKVIKAPCKEIVRIPL